MKIDTTLDKQLANILRAEEKDWKPSGKLAPSRLAWPLQWQVLYAKGVPGAPVDDYTLRKFVRGKQVEEWLCKNLPIVRQQEEKTYRGITGFADGFVDTTTWGFKVGVVPIEIKSVANSKFKRIKRSGPDRSYLLQTAFYALADSSPNFVICCVASDDLRLLVTIHDTSEYQEEIDRIIDLFNLQMESGEVPCFEPTESWQSNLKYNRYPDWDCTSDQCTDKFNALELSTTTV